MDVERDMIHCFEVVLKSGMDVGGMRRFRLKLSFVRDVKSRLKFSALLLSLSTFVSTAATAAESKWSIENILSAKDVECSTDNEKWTTIIGVTPDRELAELFIRQNNYSQAAKLLNLSISTWKDQLPADDLRIRSARLALAEVLLKQGSTGKAVACLRAVLQQDLVTDRKFERTKLPKSGPPEIESEAAFEKRYADLREMVDQNTRAAALRRAELLLFQGRVNDSLRLTRICTLLAHPDDRGAICHKYGEVVESELLFVQSMLFAKLGDKSGFDDVRVQLHQLSSDCEFTDLRKQLAEAMSLQLSKKYKEAKILFAKVKNSIKGESLQDNYNRQITMWLSADNLADFGDSMGAYLEYNATFEYCRRHVDGYPNGLFLFALENSSLKQMTRCVEVRFAQLVASEGSHPTFNHQFPSPSQTHYCSLLSRYQQASSDGEILQGNEFGYRKLYEDGEPRGQQEMGSKADTAGSGSFVTTKFSKDDLQELVGALSHVAYQHKSGNKPQAQRLFWQSVCIREHFQLPIKKTTVGILYDLAESYYWEQKFDLAAQVFNKCIQVGLENDPDDASCIMIHSTLGRVHLGKGDAIGAINCMKRGLHLLVCREKMQASKISRLMSDINRTKSRVDNREELQVVSQLKSPRNSETFVRQLSSLPLPVQLDVVAETRKESSPEVYPQIDDLWNVLADAYSRNRSYDEAAEVSRRMLEMKRSNPACTQDDLLGSVWQLAYICGVSNRMEEAKVLYSEMIDKRASSPGRPLADWLSSRGVINDTLGQVDAAKADFKRAIANYKKASAKLDKVKDAEQIQQIGWMVADLKYELKAKSRCPQDAKDYTKGYESDYWSKDRFPLKVFIDQSEDRGFGPKLYAYMKKSVEEWKQTRGMEDKVVYVDDREKADIYIERLSNYDLIPYGSGGGATGSFVQGANGKLTRELDKVHLRLYCPDYDLDRLSNYTVEQLYTLALHEFGHGLGLAHSPSGLDVMYWKSGMKELSERDRATLLKKTGFKVEKRD